MQSATSETIEFRGRHLEMRVVNGWEYAARAQAHGAVGILAITPADNVVLVEQYRPPLRKNTMELPAGLAGDGDGHLDATLADCARRELLEETGYRCGRLKLLTEGPSSAGLTTETVTLFLAEDLERVHDGGGTDSESIVVHEVPRATLAG